MRTWLALLVTEWRNRNWAAEKAYAKWFFRTHPLRTTTLAIAFLIALVF